MSLKKATEKLVEKLLLCDPVTERGRDQLYALGLQREITPNNFFSGPDSLWVKPADLAMLPLDEELDYDTSPNQQRIHQIVTRRQRFDSRFHGLIAEGENRRIEKREFTLLMGVVGAGKSIELQRQIYSNYNGIPYSYSQSSFQNDFEKDMIPNVVNIDLERVNVEIDIGTGFRCQDSSNSLDLFFTKLLATLINYIKFLYMHHRDRLRNVNTNLQDIFNNKDRQTSSVKKYNALLDEIFLYSQGKSDLENVFAQLLSAIKADTLYEDPITGEKEDPKEARIRAVLHLLGIIMDGANPNEKKCIVVDNVEDYIKISGDSQIAVSLDHASKIYGILSRFSEAIKDRYNQAGITGSFHVVMALRRTTWDNLQSKFYGNQNAIFDDIFDLTGDVSLTELWNKKGYPIWEKYLKDQYDDLANNYIDKVNELLNDDVQRNSIQERFSRLMSHGLRRQGHSLSVTLYDMFFDRRFGIFLNKSASDYILRDSYNTLYDEAFSHRSEARYLRRSSVVELYLMKQLACTGVDVDASVGKRWKGLNIGIIKRENKEDYYYSFNGYRRTEGIRKPFSLWEYNFKEPEKSNRLLRQVLRTLRQAQEAPRASKCVAPLYEAVSLFDLISRTTTSGDSGSQQELLALSSLLLAGARPDVNAEFSPLFLLQDGVDYEDEYTFLDKLIAVKKADRAGSGDGNHPYCRQKHGVRITEAGADFLHNIQPSFEYFSSLFCNDYPPLLFIRSTELIAHVIGCVYRNAVRVCTENKNSRDDTVLISKENREYAEAIQVQHTRFLKHYRDFIENCGTEIGLSAGEITWIMLGVNSVIDNYNAWKVKENV